MANTMNDERRYYLAFNLTSGVGPTRLRLLRDRCGSLAAAWQASAATLQATGLDGKTVEAILSKRAKLDLDAELAKLERLGVSIVTWDDNEYPLRLREIANSPPLLYVRGEVGLRDETAVAIVGTREMSPYGKQIAYELGRDLAQNGVTVVSGLARGVDTEAHRGALAVGGRTIAVLGCGVDTIHPFSNRQLGQQIIANGALVSDYAVGIRPEAANFPPRNRIISGLSLGVIVVEAGARSGALITVAFALEQGREVFSVPGDVTRLSSIGTNDLIRNGARLVSSAQDVLDELRLADAPVQLEMKQMLPSDPTESRLLTILSRQPQHLDEISRESELSAAQVSATLLMMALKGMVREVGPGLYVSTLVHFEGQDG